MEFYTTSGLSHHGILGQKWGVRRYQNKDGSLTSAGKKRYGSSLRTMWEEKFKYQEADAEAARNMRDKNRESKRQLREGVIDKKQHRANKKANAEEYYNKTVAESEKALKNIANKTSRGRNVALATLGTAGGIAGLALGQYIAQGGYMDSKRIVGSLLASSLGGALLGTGVGAGMNEAVISAKGYRNNSNIAGKKKETPDWVLSEKPKNNSKFYKYSQDVINKDTNRKKYSI